jgi:hypothetical protein
MSKLNINPEHLSIIAARLYAGDAVKAVNEATLIILECHNVANEQHDLDGCEEQKGQ